MQPLKNGKAEKRVEVPATRGSKSREGRAIISTQSTIDHEFALVKKSTTLFGGIYSLETLQPEFRVRVNRVEPDFEYCVDRASWRCGAS